VSRLPGLGIARGLLCAALCTNLAVGSGITSEESRGLTENVALLKGSVTVVVFLSARCPVSNAYGDRLQRAYDDYHGRGVRFLFVNSNVNENEPEIRRNSSEHGYTFSVFRDLGSRAADQFGAQATPELFVLDKDAKVRYRGAVDDAQNPARVHHNSLREALDQVLAGLPVAVTETKSFGCTIKRPRR
jgi:glutathione peroxidase-family protein